jgi:DNA transformation protein and related proteins
MSSGLIDLVRELSEPIGGVACKRMFGGWGIFRNGRMFGLVAYDTVYLKSDAQTDPTFDVEGLMHF